MPPASLQAFSFRIIGASWHSSRAGPARRADITRGIQKRCIPLMRYKAPASQNFSSLELRMEFSNDLCIICIIFATLREMRSRGLELFEFGKRCLHESPLNCLYDNMSSWVSWSPI